MIALKNNLPLVRFEDGEVRAFERDWLVRSLAAAAEFAGYPFWWLADHVAASIATFLRQDYPHAVIDLPELVSSVRSVLQVIGYPDVAPHFQPGRPPVQISLLEIAEAAGAGYELAFFSALRARVADVVERENSRVHLVDLNLCVKKLRARKIWSRDCETLQSEIVRFVRAQLRPGNGQREMWLTLT